MERREKRNYQEVGGGGGGGGGRERSVEEEGCTGIWRLGFVGSKGIRRGKGFATGKWDQN